MSNKEGPLRLRNKLCDIDSKNVNKYGMHIAPAINIDQRLEYWRSFYAILIRAYIFKEFKYAKFLCLTWLALPSDCVMSRKEPLLTTAEQRTRKKKIKYASNFKIRLVFL